MTLLEVADVMDRPRLYSTFVLWMLAQLYEQLPEVGDLPKPKLAFFFDEAHLLFDDASEALMDQIERTARLIRSKGVGVYFVTQAPTDVPSPVLSQLGNRVQHALRAFTPGRRRRPAQDRPHVPDDRPLRRRADDHQPRHRRGAGHGPVAQGRPDAARRHAPDPARLADGAADAARSSRRWSRPSALAARYGTTVDRESAHEIITARLTNAKARGGAAATAARRRGGDDARPRLAHDRDRPRGMTPAQQRREIQRQAREIEEAQRARRAGAQGAGARRHAPTQRSASR